MSIVRKVSPSSSGTVPADGSVTNIKVASNAAISADKLVDGASNKIMTSGERTKLAGLATIATSGSAADLIAGTAPTARLGSGTASSATFLCGDQTWTDISEIVRDTIGSALQAGVGVRVTPDDINNIITIDSVAVTTNTQSGTAYTLVASDVGKVVEMTSASANTVTVPSNASVSWPLGAFIAIRQYGTGATTIASPATIRSYGAGMRLGGQYAEATLTYRGNDEWILSGETAV